MKKVNLFIIFIILFAIFAQINVNFTYFSAFALSGDGDPSENFVIYDQDNRFISEKSAVDIDDTFVSQDFYEYRVYKIVGKKAYAKRVRKIFVPEIKRDDITKIAPINAKNKKICLYCTHNDESFVPTDGYDSIYGAGGIHDVAKSFQEQLEKQDIDVVFDQTLHIPHDSNAYSRSAVTANRLVRQELPDAIFDIHRDGVSKNYYLLQQNNQNFSKIRIVLGKSNQNFDKNYQFAQKVFAIGNSMYPGMFLDIYCGKGHYNQALMTTALLFEMGTYLIEKEFVLASVPRLAEVVNIALYGSKTDQNGDITVDNSAPQTNPSPVVNQSQTQNRHPSAAGIACAIIIPLGIIGGVIFIYLWQKNKGRKKGR